MNNELYSASAEIYMVNIRICVLFLISVLLLVIAIKTSRKYNTKNKSKEYKGVISPILAEVLVDGKIDIKNLVLTTIVELQIKGNIDIVNDNVIELLHKNNLSLHELYLVDMIFLDKKVITFNEINDRFVYSKFAKANFIESMSKISREIQSKLYEMKVFSKRKMVILNLNSYLSMLILINLPSIIAKANLTQYTMYLFITVFISVIASVVFFSRLLGENNLVDSFKIEFGRIRKSTGMIALCFGTSAILLSILPLIKFSLSSIIGILIVYGINLIILGMTKNNVLSDKGIEERRKVLELKNFLEDYEFRKLENGEFYIIWNEYFAYAAAFGISNPVISDIYWRWNKLNITLSFTNNLI